MQSTYDAALAKVLEHEGGYSNHPSDPGGPTNWGITLADARKYWKANANANDVKNMPVSVAKDIYRRHYAEPLAYFDLPAGVDYAVLDYGINSGISRSAKVLQAVVGVDVDGEIGPDTIRATKAKGAQSVIKAICDERLAFLKGLKTWDTFGKGWGRRVAEVRATALQMAADAVSAKPAPTQPANPGLISRLLSAIAAWFKPAPKLIGDPPWLTGARADLGFHEKGVNLGIERFIKAAKTGSLGDPWCAIWVNAKLEDVNIRGSRSPAARSFETDPNFVKLPGPALGAIGTQWRGSKASGSGHVWFYLGENNDGYLGLGANQADQVSVNLQPKSRNTGFWWPKSVPLPKTGPIISSIKAAESASEV